MCVSSSCVARPQQPPIFLLFAFAAIFLSVGPVSCMCFTARCSTIFCRCCNSLGRSCCFLVLLVLSPRPSLYYLLSPPQFFSPSVLLLACVACLQQLPIFLLFAFAAIFLSVGPVSCMCCPPSATARLSRKIMCCPSLSVAMAGASCGKAHNQVDKQKKQTWGSGREGIARQVSLLHCV